MPLSPPVYSVNNIDGSLTFNPIQTEVIGSINLAHQNNFITDLSVADEVYGPAWDGSLEVPTKNAVYDKIQTIAGGAVSSVSNTDTTLTISPTTGAVIASRPAITGDISIPVGSNIATISASFKSSDIYAYTYFGGF